MNVIFLDIDGVLNSYQSDIYNRITHPEGKITNFIHGLGHKLLDLIKNQKFRTFLMNNLLYRVSNHCILCPIACSNLQYILMKCPSTKIVVSSVWRHWGLFWMKRILKRNGIQKDNVIDITGNEQGVRGVQIKAWLDRHKGEVAKFAIIDDDSDMDVLAPYLYQTDGRFGLQFDNVEKIIEYFNAI